MTSAEIIAIGTELLLGESQDTNTSFIARELRDQGINLYRTTMVGDNEERISSAIREALTRTEIVVTTGGLGPTVDDATRAAVARAVDVSLEFHQDLWDEIQARFQMLKRPITENNRIQAYIPSGAITVRNPVGTASAFIVEIEEKTIASLPGVPGEMGILLRDSIIPFFRKKYLINSIILAKVIHCSGIGESMVDNLISDLEKYSNPTVGLLAHPGLVDIRITAQAISSREAEEIMLPIIQIINNRLGENIFGENDDTLVSVVSRNLSYKRISLNLFECLQNFSLQKYIPDEIFPWSTVKSSADGIPKSNFLKEFSRFSKLYLSPSLGTWGVFHDSTFELELILSDASKKITQNRVFSGPPGSTEYWLTNTILDFLRRNLG